MDPPAMKAASGLIDELVELLVLAENVGKPEQS